MPTPWITRKPISMPMDWERPASAEPVTKTTMASWTSSFLLKRSESLPQIGVAAVAARSAAVTTQVYCDWVPSSLEVIVGSALATMVELSRPTNSASSRPLRASNVSRLVIAAVPAAGVGARCVVLMQVLRGDSGLVGPTVVSSEPTDAPASGQRRQAVVDRPSRAAARGRALSTAGITVGQEVVL